MTAGPIIRQVRIRIGTLTAGAKRRTLKRLWIVRTFPHVPDRNSSRRAGRLCRGICARCIGFRCEGARESSGRAQTPPRCRSQRASDRENTHTICPDPPCYASGSWPRRRASDSPADAAPHDLPSSCDPSGSLPAAPSRRGRQCNPAEHSAAEPGCISGGSATGRPTRFRSNKTRRRAATSRIA